MKPLNSTERTKAFYKVIGLFVLCFALAILLGFSTMNVNKMMDYASRKQLEGLRNDLLFQEKVFQPNIENATKKLQDLPHYKERSLILEDLVTSINVTLEKIKSEWTVDETNPQYIMYKNIVETYFALQKAYIDKFKLEEQLEAKENVVVNGSGDLQREINKRDDLENENKSLKSNLSTLNTNVADLQSQAERLQKQLTKCRDSLKICLVENRGYKQQRKN
jgi:hypothetical protein